MRIGRLRINKPTGSPARDCAKCGASFTPPTPNKRCCPPCGRSIGRRPDEYFTAPQTHRVAGLEGHRHLMVRISEEIDPARAAVVDAIWRRLSA